MKERLREMILERTLILIKPDGVKRGLIGEIFHRFKRAGLKIVACKMVFASREQLSGHFPKDKAWIRGMGEKSLEAWREHEKDPVEILGTADPDKIGQMIAEWNYDYLMSGPIVAVVLEGTHSVETVRKIVGNTSPSKAEPGTIRGDFASDSPDLANVEGRAVHNLVHASGNLEEANQEIANWFSPDEIMTHGKNKKGKEANKHYGA